MNKITFEQIMAAAKKIIPYIHVTPIIRSKHINEITGRNVFFKCENLQKTGSFKFRGAANNILIKHEDEPLRGVISHSLGNHTLAVALMASELNLPCIIVLPHHTSKSHIDAIQNYKGNIVFCKDTQLSRIETCACLAAEHEYSIISADEDVDTLVGQGTLGLEFLAQIPQLDTLITSVGSGNLSSGCAVVTQSLKPYFKVYCVEPKGKELQKSLEKGERLWKGTGKHINTIASGMKVLQPGILPFPILCQRIEKEVFTVDNDDIIAGMKLSREHLQQDVEASAGAAVQALIKYKDSLPESSKNIGVVLSGGNVETDINLNKI